MVKIVNSTGVQAGVLLVLVSLAVAAGEVVAGSPEEPAAAAANADHALCYYLIHPLPTAARVPSRSVCPTQDRSRSFAAQRY